MAEIPLNPLSAAFRGFQGAQQRRNQLEQQEAANQLTEQLRQIQLLSAQQAASEAPMRQALLEQQLRRALMTPEQVAIENAKASNIAQLASQPGVVFQQGGPIEEVTPEAQELIGLRQVAELQGGVPFSREGIPGIQMQTTIPGLPGAVRSPAEIQRLQDQAKINAALRRELEGPKLQEVGNTLLRVPATGAPEVLFKGQTNAAQKFEFVKNINDPKDVRYLPINPETGTPPEGYTFVKSGDGGMKPNEIISSRKEIRDTYEKLPSKLDYFGSGQVRGSRGLKEDLDSVLKSKSVNGDFNKLTGTASDYFITRMNKLSDPTSATLISEADRIAGRVGVGDQLLAYFKGLKTGQKISPEIAKQIYDVISSVEASQKESLINSLIPLDDDVKMLGKDLTFIGVPSDIQKEVEARIASGTKPGGNNSTENSGKVRVIRPDGRTSTIPSNQLQEALSRGYKQVQ